jgi:NodT family efflux transporter outer membrane factor (OMF) lipoprotein
MSRTLISEIRIWNLFRASCLMLGVFVASGCMVGPNFHEPKVDAPRTWSSTSPTTAPSTQVSIATTQPADLRKWWLQFDDARLNSLIDRAIQSNLDLQLAAARVRQARASRGVVASGFWPTADVSASYTRSDTGGGRATVNGNVVSSGHDLYRAGLDASWELDVFGGVRRNIEAAEADIAAAVEDQRDVLVTLISEVALNYTDLRSFQQRIAIAKQNLEAQRRSAEVTRRRFAGGFVSGLDVANADAEVASTASQIPVLEMQARQTIYAISVLLGREPGALLDELALDASLPRTPPDVPVGLPSELLRRRPDIRRSEAQLHAATARVGVATADLFPQFSLTGSLGTQGEKFKSLGNWSSHFWNIGPSVSWPLFDAGRIQANVAVQNASQQQALLTFRSTVLTALQEVENSLIAYAKEQEHREALVDAVNANRRAVSLATTLYTQGQTDFLNVLSAQRSLYASEDALAQSDHAVAADLIALYKALGGGWDFQ